MISFNTMEGREVLKSKAQQTQNTNVLKSIPHHSQYHPQTYVNKITNNAREKKEMAELVLIPAFVLLFDDNMKGKSGGGVPSILFVVSVGA